MGEEPAVRRWVKGCGIALIAAVWLPVVGVLVLPGVLWRDSERTRAGAAAARAAVRLGSTLGDAITAAEIRCYQVWCQEPAEAPLAMRTDGSLRASDGAGGLRDAATLLEWRERLRGFDAGACTRAVFTLCGRPRATFSVELDAAGRVRGVGELSLTGD